MPPRTSHLAALLTAALLGASLSGPAGASAKPLKAKVVKAPDGPYAGADGRKNH